MNSVRINQLTFTRFVAAIAIVIFHFGRETFLFTNDSLSIIFAQANIGVSYFYILSGFVMIIAYNHKLTINAVEYLKNRFARIYPLYLFSIGLCVFMFLLLNEFSLTNFLLNVFMIQSWVPGKALTLTYTGWSLAVELFFYVLFPFLFNRLYQKFKLKTIAIGIIVFWIVSQVIFHLVIADASELMERFYYYLPILHLNEFLVGNLAGIVFMRNLNKVRRNYDLLLLFNLVLMYLAFKYDLGLTYHNGLFAVLFVPFIYFLSSNSGNVTKVFSTKPFVFLGEISYGIYILQVPVWGLITDYRLEKYLGIEKAGEYNFYIKFIILLVVSSMTYLWIEKPMRKKIKNFNFQKLRLFKLTK